MPFRIFLKQYPINRDIGCKKQESDNLELSDSYFNNIFFYLFKIKKCSSMTFPTKIISS